MSDAEKLVGQTLAGKYLIKRLLGAGGMGAVYEGQHVEIGKRVAVKVITQTSSAHSAEAEARFRREARAASAVESEHIVQVFDVGQDPDAGLYMVMEYLTGEDLSTRLAREKRLDIGTALVIATQAARGLAKAHTAGVVHRDLKPANIFLITREDGSLLVKVLDFGISKLLSEVETPTAPASSKLTRVGSVIGTPQYMSPEQAQGLPNVDHRTDIWSLGAVVYECLAGKPAYDELGTYEQTIIRIVTTQAPQLAEAAPWVPPAVAAVVHRALIADVATRMPDCGTFARALAEAMPTMFPDASGQYGALGAARASAIHASNPAFLASDPSLAGTVAATTGSGSLAVVSLPTTGSGARPLSQREIFGSTVAATGSGGVVLGPPRTPAVTTGTGVAIAKGAGPASVSGGRMPSIPDDSSDEMGIPGVPPRGRSPATVILAVLAAATVGGLLVGGLVVMRGKAATAAADAPQGLVVPAAQPAATAPPAAQVAASIASLGLTPQVATPTPAPSASAKPAKVAARVSAPAASAPSASAKPTPAAKEPAGGGSFGGVNISDQY